MKKLPVQLSKKEFTTGLGLLLFQQLVLPDLIMQVAAMFRLVLTAADLNFTFFLINFLSVIIVFRRFISAEAEVALQRIGLVISSAVLCYFLNAVLGYAVSRIVYLLSPDFTNLNDAYIGSMTKNQVSMMVVGTVLLVPPAEEFLFRGVLFNRLYHKKPLVATVLSVCLFSLVHLIGYIDQYTPLQFFLAFLQYVPAGVALCVAYIRSGTIFAPILLHTAVNAIAMSYYVQ